MHAVRVDGAMSLRTTLAIRLIGLVIAATKGTSNMLCHSPPCRTRCAGSTEAHSIAWARTLKALTVVAYSNAGPLIGRAQL